MLYQQLLRVLDLDQYPALLTNSTNLGPLYLDHTHYWCYFPTYLHPTIWIYLYPVILITHHPYGNGSKTSVATEILHHIPNNNTHMLPISTTTSAVLASTKILLVVLFAPSILLSWKPLGYTMLLPDSLPLLQ